MKAWQKGYEIEELEHGGEKFKNFNSYNHNPFLQVKKFFLVKFVFDASNLRSSSFKIVDS